MHLLFSSNLMYCYRSIGNCWPAFFLLRLSTWRHLLLLPLGSRRLSRVPFWGCFTWISRCATNWWVRMPHMCLWIYRGSCLPHPPWPVPSMPCGVLAWPMSIGLGRSWNMMSSSYSPYALPFCWGICSFFPSFSIPIFFFCILDPPRLPWMIYTYGPCRHFILYLVYKL